MPFEAARFKTHRETVFGRGFIQLDQKNEAVDSNRNFCLLLVSEFEIKVLKANQGQPEHSLLIEQLSLDSDSELNKTAAIDINSIEVNEPSHLVTIYIHDKETDRFMPICHIAQSGAASGTLSVLETCLTSVKKEFGKLLKPKSI